jgi:hypothetical protein
MGFTDSVTKISCLSEYTGSSTFTIFAICCDQPPAASTTFEVSINPLLV